MLTNHKSDWDFNDYMYPSSWFYDDATQDKLDALDLFRTGDIDDAFELMDLNFELSDEDSKFISKPPDYGEFVDWESMDLFLEWAEQAANIIAKYESPDINSNIIVKDMSIIVDKSRDLVAV